MANRMKKKATPDDGALARLVEYYEDSVSTTAENRRLAERDRDYVDNKQWTAEEKEELEVKRKQPCITINRIKPKVDFLLGTERQTRTDPRAYPRNPMDEKSSEMATDALRYVADCNDFDSIRSEAFENLIVEGAGAAIVEMDAKRKIKIRLIPWDRFFFDPHSRARDFSDALYVGIVLWMDQSQVKATFSETAEDVWANCLEETSETYADRPKSMWISANRKRVKVVEIYYMEGAEWMTCTFTKGGYLRTPAASGYMDEDNVPCNPICAMSAHVDRENNRYGVVRQLIGVQDEINKRRSKALHLISVRQIQVERGAVDNINTIRNELAKPDGVIETNPGSAFQILPTNDMAQGNMALLQEAKQEIDAVGANAALQGKQEQSASGRALQSRQQAGLVELGPVFDSLRQWQRAIYRQVWYRIKQFWDGPMWVRVTDDEKNLKYVGVNITQGEKALQQAREQGATPEQLQELQMQIQMDPRMQMPAEETQVARMDMDIIVAESPDTVNLQGEQFEMLVQMYQANPQAIPFDLVIEASSLRNKDKLLERMKGDDNPQAKEAKAREQQMAQQLQMRGATAEIAGKEADAESKRTQALKNLADAEQTKVETMLLPGQAAQQSMEAERSFALNAHKATQPSQPQF